MIKLFTVGFTKKSAEDFFELLKRHEIRLLIDVRLNNTSQLAGFSKFPDIEYFLREICRIDYKHEVLFAPEEKTLSDYKKKIISWDDYVAEFDRTMENRSIREYIKSNYRLDRNTCLLCSEATPEQCHRRLIAEIFAEVFPEINISHI